MPQPVSLTVRPLQWSCLADLHETPSLDDTDQACLADLRAVLARHGKLDRFAVHLAHRHFELAEGEVLIERPDPDGRTQHVTVGRLTDEPDARPTTWLFEKGPALQAVNDAAVYCVCVSDPVAKGACIGHGKSPSPGEHAVNEEKARNRRIQREEAARRHRPPAHDYDDGRER